MKVSIIMCAYNVSQFIERAVESVLAQTWTDWELIICDDRSTDNTIALIQPYLSDPRVTLYQQDQNIGYLRNKNFAFTLATGELLTQLDADDTCSPQRLERQVAVFEKHPDINLCGSNYCQIDLNDQPLAAKKYEKDFVVDHPVEEYPFWFPGLMFRRELVGEFGLFSEYFSGIFGDDHYWVLRVNSKYPVYFIKDILYHYRINPDSITNVLDSNRKLIVTEILNKLRQQQLHEKTDWLEQGDENKMRSYEDELLSNKTLMATKYRTWAAKAIDKNNFTQAKALLRKSLALNAVSPETYKTFLYYIRQSVFK
ncbi:MAG TPA: glycosyltransferase family A protein [Flavipsychrobacter sp.]|nr:glycosyltransferase family A protein [Flavipsychrobacter sp.]